MSKHQEYLDMQTLFRGCMINYDPTSYDLKKKLFASDKNFIVYYADMLAGNTISLLLNALYDSGDFTKTPYSSAISTDHKDNIIDLGCKLSLTSGEENIDEYIETYKGGFSIAHSMYYNCIYNHNNLYISKLGLKELFKRSVTPLSNKNILDKAIVYLCTAILHEDSLIKDLGWLLTKFKNLSYNDLIDLTPYINILNYRDSDGLYSFIKDVQHKLWDIKYSSHSYEDVLLSEYKILLFGIELMYLVEQIPDDFIKQELYKSLFYNMKSYGSYFFTLKASGEYEPIQQVKEIIKIKDKKTRFNAIREYVQAVGKAGYINAAGIPTQMCKMFISFCQVVALQNMTIKKTELLYNFCKANKYLKKKHTDALSAHGARAIGAAGAEDDEISPWIPEELRETSYGSTLLDEDEDAGAKDIATKDKTLTTLEAFDLLTASYREDKYSFDVNHIMPDTAYRAAYEDVAEKIKFINMELIKDIKEIKTYNTGGKEPGKSRGRIDRKNVYKYKTDKNIFYDNSYKIKEQDLAFGIVLDVSGSMHGRGIENGRITMVLLHETLRSLGINHSIITHTSSGRMNTQIEVYQEFKESKLYKVQKNYNLMKIKAQDGNCDSGALYYMERALMNTTNKDKICIIFSDGRPTECTSTDLKQQVALMERRGIKVIGVGVNYEAIKEYYNDFANGKTLGEMIRIVSDILKRYVLEKKD